MVAALHKQIEIGHHIEGSLEAQLKSTQTDSSKLSKEELSLSRAAVRCWVRKLRVQSEQLGSLHADLSEVRRGVSCRMPGGSDRLGMKQE